MIGYFKAMFSARRRVGGILSAAVLLSGFLYAFSLHLGKYLYIYVNANWLDSDHILISVLNFNYMFKNIIPYVLLMLGAGLISYVLLRRRVESFGVEAPFWESIPIKPVNKILVRLLFDGLWASALILVMLIIQFACESMFNMTDRWSINMVLGMWIELSFSSFWVLLMTDVLQHLFKRIPSDLLAISLIVPIAWTIYALYAGLVGVKLSLLPGSFLLSGLMLILFAIQYKIISRPYKHQIH
ncbi:hypothetical protein R9X47_26930 [Wukongibacter baidiensis]|uniref:hypothetical protein n=1 Tax=Wukongibacter baidiensis TaxID=1723361 RepID=UPI003D7F6355